MPLEVSAKEEVLRKQRESYHKHRDKRLAAKKLYGEKNRDLILARKKIYYQANLDKIASKRAHKREALAQHINNVQQSLCAICKNPEYILNSVGQLRLLNQDHNHKNGMKRAFLCMDCNTGLGKFLDDPELLRQAALYIEEWEKIHKEAAQE